MTTVCLPGVKCRLEPAGASHCCLVHSECILLVALLCGGTIEGFDGHLSLCCGPGLFTKFTEEGHATLYCHPAGVRLIKAMLFNKVSLDHCAYCGWLCFVHCG